MKSLKYLNRLSTILKSDIREKIIIKKDIVLQQEIAKLKNCSAHYLVIIGSKTQAQALNEAYRSTTRGQLCIAYDSV